MTPIQIAAALVAYLLAFARLLDAARWAWSWLPAPVQPVLPAVVAAVPLAVEAFTGVQTREQLVIGIVVAVGAFATAIRGALPKSVFERLDERSQAVLKLAREGTSARTGERGFISFAGLRVVLVTLLVIVGVACSAAATKVVAKTAIEVAAELLCSDFFAKKQGISPDQARELFCANKDILDPFLEQALAAQQSAGATALPLAQDAASQ